MSTSVDRRIVEMEFDNQQFERGVTSTLNLLDQLKESLEFKNAARGLSALERALNGVDFSGISDSIYAIEERFSVMGIVAKRVIEDITDVAFGMLKKVTSATIGQIYSGGLTRALNIEQAKFQLEGLDVAWEDIKDDILYGVRDTAYGLDEAARVASQLVASGIPVGEMMQSTLRGISGVAAMTNSTYTDIGNIFTTIASNGKLMTMQLRQLSFRGLNVAAILAKALHKTEAEINEMVTKGQIDFMTFATAMNNAFGEQATKANETFTGSLANLKAALSRIGADVAAQGLTSLRDIFNELRTIVDDIHERINPLLESISNLISGTSNLAVKLLKNQMTWAIIEKSMETFATIGSAVKDILDSIGESFRELFLQAAPIQDMYQYFVIFQVKIRNAFIAITNFVNAIKLTSEELDSVRRIFNGIFTVFQIGAGIIREIASAIGFFGDDLLDLRANALERLALIGDYFVQLKDTILPAIHSIRNGIINWIQSIDWSRVIAPLKDIKDDIVNWFQSVDWNVILQPIQNGIQRFAQWFHSIDWNNIFTPLKTAWDWLKSLDIGTKVSKVIGAIVFVWNYIKTIDFKTILNLIIVPFQTLWNVISTVVTKIKGLLEVFFDLFRTEPENPLEEFTDGSAVNGVQRVVNAIDGARNVVDGLSDSFTGLRRVAARIVITTTAIFNTLRNAASALTEKVNVLKEGFARLFPSVSNFIGQSRDVRLNTWARLFELISNGVAKIHEKMTYFIHDVLGIQSLHDALVAVGDIVKIIIGLKFGDMLSGIGTGARLFGQGMANFGANGLFQANGLKPIITMGDTINGVTTGLNTKAIRDFAIAIGIFALALLVLSSIDVDKLGSAVTALTIVITEIGVLITSIGRSMGPAETRSATIVLNSLIPLGVTLLLIGAALKLVSDIPWQSMIKSIIGLSLIIALLSRIVYQLGATGEMRDAGQALVGALAIQMLAGTLIIIGLALRLVNNMNWAKLAPGLLSMLGVLGIMYLIVASFMEMPEAKIQNAIAGALAIQMLSSALVVIAVALRIVNNMNWEALAPGLLSLLGTFSILFMVVEYLAKMKSSDITNAIAGAYSIQMLSTTLLIIGAALRIVNNMEWDKLKVGFLALLATFSILFMVIEYLAKMQTTDIGNAILGAASIVILSSSLLIIGASLKMVNGINWETMWPGLVGLIGLFALLSIVIVALSKLSKSDMTDALAGAIAIGILSLSLLNVAKSLLMLNGLNWDSILPGLLSLLAVFSLLSLFTMAMASLGPMALAAVAAAVAVLIMANSLVLVAGVVATIAAIPNAENLSKIMGSFAAGLAKLGLGLVVLGLGAVGAKALINLAKGLALLIPVLTMMASLPVNVIQQGIANLVSMLWMMAIKLLEALPAMLVITVLSGALVIFAAAMLTTSVAITAFTGALSILLAFINGNMMRISTMITNIAGLISQALSSIMSLIWRWAPIVSQTLILLINQLLTVVQGTWPRFKDTITIILTGLLDVVIAMVPKIKQLVSSLLDMLLDLITEYIPRACETLLNLVSSLATLLEEKIPEFVTSGMNIIAGFLNGVAEKIDDVIDAGVNLIVNFLDGLSRNADEITNAGFNFVINFINGVANSVRENHEAFGDAIQNLIDAGMEATADWVADALEVGANFVAGLIEGLVSMASELWDTVCGLGEDILEALGVTLDENSPSKEAAKMGRFFDQGLIKGLNDEANAVALASSNVGDGMIDGMAESLNELSDRIQNGLDTEPVIRPVMDLSDIESGATRIGSLLSMNQSVGLHSAIRGINAVNESNDILPNSTRENVTNVNFTQNNYSPESLSRLDIYRDTEHALGLLGEWNNQ